MYICNVIKNKETMTTTKKIRTRLYLHINSNKYISSFVGCSSTLWNIFNDEYLCDEFAIGFNTKWQAIEYLNSLNK
jgi:hypothetical protein